MQISQDWYRGRARGISLVSTSHPQQTVDAQYDGQHRHDACDGERLRPECIIEISHFVRYVVSVSAARSTALRICRIIRFQETSKRSWLTVMNPLGLLELIHLGSKAIDSVELSGLSLQGCPSPNS